MLKGILDTSSYLIGILEEDISLKEARYNQQKGRRDQLRESISQKENDLAESIKKKELLEEVNILFHETADFARDQSRQQIESLVTKFLQYVFGENFSFEIELEQSRGQAWAEFYVVSNQGEYKVKNKPQDARGGGVVDVVSLALRVAVLESHQSPPVDGPIILDEPAKHVSEEYIVKVTKFLKEINGLFGRQIIVVTHQGHLAQVADKSFRVELKEGKSEVIDGILA